MFTHNDIWAGIDRLAGSFGYSPSGLAKQAGLDPTSFNKSKRISPDGKPRWPSTESISKILAVTGATLSELMDLAGASQGKTIDKTQALPLIKISHLDAKCFDDKGMPRGKYWHDFICDAAHFVQPDTLFAIEITDERYAPIYCAGNILIVSSAVPPAPGHRAIECISGDIFNVQKSDASGTRLHTDPTTLSHLCLSNNNHKNSTDPATILARIIWVQL